MSDLVNRLNADLARTGLGQTGAGKAAARRELAARFPGAVRLGGGPVYVRNLRGEKLLCCYSPCDKPGDDRCHIDTPHKEPRYEGEQQRWIFCSDKCRAAYLAGTRLENLA